MWEQIRSNRRKSVWLAFLMAVLLFALGYFLAEYFAPGYGVAGLFFAGVIWLVMALVSYYGGDSLFLAMSGAKKIQKQDLPVLWNVVEEMTIASGLGKMPAIYVIDDPAPNAFATGRDPEHAAVAVTSGLLRACNRDELQGVIAHEIGHVKNRDILLMLFAGVMVGAIALLAEVGLRSHWFIGGRSRRSSDSGGGQAQAIILLVALLLMILAPIIAQLIYFAISRKREYLADASAARYTRYPEGLASALEQIAAAPEKLAAANRVTAPMYIINPLKRKGSHAANLSSTHPPITERVSILRAMGGMGGISFAAYDKAFRKSKKSRRGVIPASALAEPTAEEAVRAAVTDEADTSPAAVKKRAREVDNFFYRQDAYQALTCTCGTVLKIPPGFLAAQVPCPHCGRKHATAQFQAMAPIRPDGQ